MIQLSRFSKLSFSAPFALALTCAAPAWAQPRPLLDYRGITVPNLPNSAFRVGNHLTEAGDVNGDGHDDLLVKGGILVQNPTSYSSRVLLYLGSPAGLDPTPAWVATPLTPNPTDFAEHFRGVGDVNGDGYADVMVNAYGEGTPGFYHPQLPNVPFIHQQETVYLYLGGPQGLTAQPVWSDEQPESFFGEKIAGAGDVNGDGYDDVMVGTVGLKANPSSFLEPCWQEAVYLYYGGPMGLELTPAWVQRPEHNFGCYGFSIDGAGDVNGDGYDDVIVSAAVEDRGDMNNVGEVYVYYGSAQGLAQQPSWEMPLPGDVQRSVGVGDVVLGVGDMDGDGYDDVLVRVAAYFQESTPESRYYLYRGSAQGLNSLHDRFIEVGQISLFRQDVAGHDVDGDGRADLIVEGPGAKREDLRLFHGQATSPYIAKQPAFEMTPALNMMHGWRFLYDAALPGDLDNDGYADVVVTVAHLSAAAQQGGLAVLFGGPNPAPLVAEQQLTTLANQELAITLEASDLHGDALTLSLTDPPSLGALDLSALANGEVVYRPYTDRLGQDTFEYTATDPYGNASSATISVRIESANRAPVFETEQTMLQTHVGALVELTLVATDPDGDAITYSIQSLDGASIDPQSGEFVWTPLPEQEGVFTMSFLASDGMRQAELTMIVQVGPKPLDGDEDGVPDEQDACPAEPGPPENQGCPEEQDMGSRMEPEAMDMAPDLSSPEDMTDAADMTTEEREMGAQEEEPKPVDQGCGGCQSTKSSSPSSLLFGLLGLLGLGLVRRRRLTARLQSASRG